MNISVVIPTYNESENITATIQELFTTIEKISDIDRAEIIVVDDHSSDNTFDVVKEMNDARVKVLRLSRQCGSHTALRAGIKEATGDILLTISADGQDDPACLGEMLKKWRSGAKVVWALRKSRKGEPWCIRKPAQAFYKLLIWLGAVRGTAIDISRANFCFMDRMVVDAINRCGERHTSLFGLIIWLGFNQDFVEYERRPRRFGRSKWNLNSHLYLARDWIVGFSGLPLTLISVIGVLVTAVGFLYAIYVWVKAISGIPVQSWPFIMAAVLLVGGIQMVMLGIIGEYLWKNLEESRKRPLFFIEKRSDTS